MTDRPHTRQERQQEEIVSAVRDGRVAHGLDLAFEHFNEFGADDLVEHALSLAIAERRDPALCAEYDAFLRRIECSQSL